MAVDKELKKHYQALGLADEKAYVRWCKTHGFSTGLNKSEQLRKKELNYLREQSLTKSMSAARERLNSPAEKLKFLIEQMHRQGPVDSRKESVAREFDVALASRSQTREIKLSFYQFLEAIVSATALLDRSGMDSQNNLQALGRIFEYRLWWKRRPEEFKPSTKNASRQFSQLLRHLFTDYKLPIFLDKVWLTNTARHHEWFLHLAEGGNIRKAPGLPLTLTKKQAHYFSEAPDSYSMDEALRYGQIMGLGGDKRLVDALIEARPFRDGFAHNDFWETVIQFFIQQPMLDRIHVSPICDYIQHAKYGANGHLGFSMHGRDPQALLQAVDTWHTQLRRQRKAAKGSSTWAPCGIVPFVKEAAQGRFWVIDELNSQEDLQKEGAAMRHCVASYHYSASSGRCSIWSVKYCGERKITIEVNNENRSIVQARGRFNAAPDIQSWSILQEWAAYANLKVQTRQGY